MEQRLTMHIVGGNSRSRASQSRLVLSMGHHAEVYSDLVELLDRPPHDGVIIASDDVVEDGIEKLLEELADHGIWIPLVAAREEPGVDEVVEAIQAGALDFLTLPLTEEELRRMLAHVHNDAGRHAEARRRLIDARRRISALSNREREVLDWLSEGCSNKAIARELEISPRTVEIHRANMMDKLGANHAAEAVRLRLEAGLEAAKKNDQIGMTVVNRPSPAQDDMMIGEIIVTPTASQA
ncbi:response regulator transcription factor [Aurantiacibacter sediminis]|uniref:Helix-turn-helix transcriptional regulator n=1 Tax=Aurantiacibacter sediminis TaxID=2793064 RepID=A0ABS0N2V2_9SPHN|nr:LuxR C-terminal-related transcriptional regulator [Aurantiacibacter sediminis]MBH5322047.1 helix-turn-helix transcriptional regulator [Aurantiacibacter sediminis]